MVSPSNAEWTGASRADVVAAIAAAKLQHRISRALRRRYEDLDISTEDVAAEVNLSVDQLGRILRGEAHLTFTQLQRLAAVALLRVDVEVRKAPQG